jgi:DnaJ-class molecular chaperone
MPQTHYETLGLSREATEKEIKQAYRGLSMKYHPDKIRSSDVAEQEQANSKMQEINEAYETLSDDGKRQMYNMELDGGSPFPGGGSPFPGGGVHFSHGPGFMNMGPGVHFMSGGMPPDIGNIFEMLFNQNGMGPGVFFQQRGPPPPISKNIDITLAQAYTGCMVPCEIERWVQQGELRITETETITLNIPAGADTGISIVIKGKGNAYSEAARGDVKIIINVTNDTQFQRKGNDLHFKKQITLKEALCGFQCQFVHLNGKTMVLNNASTVIFNGARKNIHGLGMTATGNLVVEFDVVFPTELTALQREALDNIL